MLAVGRGPEERVTGLPQEQRDISYVRHNSSNTYVEVTIIIVYSFFQMRIYKNCASFQEKFPDGGDVLPKPY